MKRFALSAMMLAIAASGFSQKAMVKKAKNALIEPVDLVEAKTSIEAAMSDAETSSDPNTFVLAGKIYKKIYDEEAKKKLLGQQYDTKGLTENMINSVNSYLNAAELEQVPDAKGKTTDKYDKEIKKAFADLKIDLGQTGYSCYKEKNYKDALRLFDGYLSIPNSSIMKDEKVDSTYYNVEFLAANSAFCVNDYQKAIKYLYELKDANLPEGQTHYEWLVDALQASKDTAKSMEVLAEGLKKYPTSSTMIAKQVNYYINHGKRQEAINYLDNAIAANPDKPDYYVAKADMFNFNDSKNYDETLALYQKANSIDPSNVAAIEGMGEMYAKKGELADKKADNMKSDDAYNKARKAAEPVYKEALTYLEKAKDMYGSNLNKYNLYWLAKIYNRLRMGDKFKEIQNLKKQL